MSKSVSTTYCSLQLHVHRIRGVKDIAKPTLIVSMDVSDIKI